MNELPKNWLTEMPFDYEFKYYTLLAQVKRHKGDIKDFKLLSTLDKITSSLNILYDIKYARDGEELKSARIIGIDVENMEIEYDYPDSNKDVTSMYELCDISIELFEELHKDVRTTWRNVSDMLRITNVGINSIKNSGFLYIINGSEILTYKIIIPLPFKNNWRSVSIKHVSTEEYNIKKLTKFIKVQESGLKHYRCDMTRDLPINDCVIPVLKSILYKNLI